MVRCRSLVGMTDEHVTRLLGSADAYWDDAESDWVYSLEPTCSICDSGSLHVFFRHGRVRRAEMG
ncbi:MAG: hypothetical protein JWM93_932 [Frankiales bacterium]|nr:hypothetical protein [Frankiales bacterium]